MLVFSIVIAIIAVGTTVAIFKIQEFSTKTKDYMVWVEQSELDTIDVEKLYRYI